MKYTIADIIQLATALAPFVTPTVEAIIGALKGSGALSENDIDADLQGLILEALSAKDLADKAAAGLDPQ